MENMEADVDVVAIEPGAETEVVFEAEPEGWLGIRDAAAAAGYQDQYVRQLVLKGKIPAVKLARGGYLKWYVDMVALNFWKNNRTRSGMRRFILRIDSEAEAAVREALDALVDDDGNSIEYTLALAYVPKPKDADVDTIDETADDVELVEADAAENDEFFGETA